MPRATLNVPSHRRRQKLIRLAKGNRGAKSRLFKTVKEALEKGWQYAYRDRRLLKRDYRQLWIARINAATRLSNVTYSQFINGLKQKNIQLNRKMLADLAVNDPKTFDVLLHQVMH